MEWLIRVIYKNEGWTLATAESEKDAKIYRGLLRKVLGIEFSVLIHTAMNTYLDNYPTQRRLNNALESYWDSLFLPESAESEIHQIVHTTFNLLKYKLSSDEEQRLSELLGDALGGDNGQQKS